MRGKLFVLLVGMALLVGMLSGCVEEPKTTPTVNSPPTASFTFDVVNQTVTFTDNSSDTDGNISFWSWDVDGDGVEDYTDQNPEHTYTENNKTYAVTLTVDDDGGETGTITKDVTVGTPPVPPTADFEYNTTMDVIVNETTIEFTDASEIGNSAITNWTWDFGDETYSYDQNATHMYTAIGNYTVTLTITDANGEEDAATAEITVIEAEV